MHSFLARHRNVFILVNFSICMDLKKEVSENSILLSILPKEYYSESIMELVNNLNDKKICYVTLNKTTEALKDSFKIHNINTKNILFVDAVSMGIGNYKEQENTVLVSSPIALTELSLVITKILEKSKIDVLIFDSLSTLNIYESHYKGIDKFVLNLMNKVRSCKKKGIFTCLEEDVNTDLIKDSFMYADKPIKFADFADAIKQRKVNIAAITLSAITVALLLPFLNLGFGSSIKTGFAMSTETFASSRSIFFILVLLIILVFIVLFALRNKKGYLALVPNKFLLIMVPIKQNMMKIKSSIDNIISDFARRS